MALLLSVHRFICVDDAVGLVEKRFRRIKRTAERQGSEAGEERGAAGTVSRNSRSAARRIYIFFLPVRRNGDELR
ncbi:hypothetical protein D3C77_436990 [compost metagenome]